MRASVWQTLKHTMGILTATSLLMAIASTPLHAYEKPSSSSNSSADCESERLFVFSWFLKNLCNMSPRGGTTQGNQITLDTTPHSGWLALQEEDISDYERDRRAILAMAGPYRTSFNFIETVGFTKDFSPDKPYQSWGTEYVYVVEDKKDYISLQHIMVMYFEQDGKLTGPMVMKHWRQDWEYQKRELLTFDGFNRWSIKKMPKKAVKGTWSQAVYQVDDSPRYESYGRWQHQANLSTWVSEKTWRPLPRREHSVRNDYQVLEGFNRHTIVPNGWVHEEENYKLVLDKNDQDARHYLSKEQGVNRYERIVEHDFSAGDRYWQNSGLYWQHVREAWAELIADQRKLTLAKRVEGVPLFVPLFDYAQRLQEQPYDEKAGKAFIRSTLERYLVTASS